MSKDLSPQKLVRCWNCKHLKNVHEGEPKGGKLFAKKVRRCAVHGTVLEKHYEIMRERECSNHAKFGLWGTPPAWMYRHMEYIEKANLKVLA